MDNLAGPLFGMLCGGFFFLLFLGLGIFLIYRTQQSKKKAQVSQSWPSTTGQITDSQVSRSQSTDSDGDTSTSYSAQVAYTYQVGEQTYSGKQIAFGFNPSYSSESKAQADAARYPVGSQVPVYYDPSKPSDAVLQRQVSGSKVGLILGIIFIIIGVCVTCPVMGVTFASLLSSLGN
jgi:Protein of unknown function (DUF3592)